MTKESILLENCKAQLWLDIIGIHVKKCEHCKQHLQKAIQELVDQQPELFLTLFLTQNPEILGFTIHSDSNYEKCHGANFGSSKVQLKTEKVNLDDKET